MEAQRGPTPHFSWLGRTTLIRRSFRGCRLWPGVPGGSTHGYSSVALTSPDGKHTVAVGANAFAFGPFYEQVEKAARDLYCQS